MRRKNKNNRIHRAVQQQQRRWRKHVVGTCTKIIFIVNFINISLPKLSVPSPSFSVHLSLFLSAFYLIIHKKGPDFARAFTSPAVTFRPNIYSRRRRRRKFNITRALPYHQARTTNSAARNDTIYIRFTILYRYRVGIRSATDSVLGP